MTKWRMYCESLINPTGDHMTHWILEDAPALRGQGDRLRRLARRLINFLAYGTRRLNSAFTGLSINLYPEPNQPNSSYWYLSLLRFTLILSFHLRLGPSNGLFPVDLPKILKALLPFPILNKWPAHPNLLDLITLTILGKYGYHKNKILKYA